MPFALKLKDFKNEWFEFFKSISYNNSEVGDYKVTAGVFRSHLHLERYSVDSMRKVQENEFVNRDSK